MSKASHEIHPRHLLPLLLLGAVASLGCGDAGEPTFSFDWGLAYVQSGEVLSCTQAATPRVDLDILDLQTNKDYHDTFTCDAHGGVSRELPSGTYTITARLRDDTGRIVAESDPELGDIYRHGGLYLGTVVFQIQAFDFGWSLVRGNQAVTCAQAGAAKVRLITQLGEEPPIMREWNCTVRAGITGAIPTGSYSVQVQLVDANGQVLSDTKPMTFRVDGTHLAQLPDITFEVQ